jgi:hypothetical protein
VNLDPNSISCPQDIPIILIHTGSQSLTMHVASNFPVFAALNKRFRGIVKPVHALNTKTLREQLVDGLRDGTVRIVVATLVLFLA